MDDNEPFSSVTSIKDLQSCKCKLIGKYSEYSDLKKKAATTSHTVFINRFIQCKNAYAVVGSKSYRKADMSIPANTIRQLRNSLFISVISIRHILGFRSKYIGTNSNGNSQARRSPHFSTTKRLCNAKVTGPIIAWLTKQLFIYALIQSFKLKSSTYLTEPSPNKQCCLIASFRGKNYLQINAFLASGGKVERNLEALQMKTIISLGGGAIEETPSSIKGLGRSHHTEQWQERWLTRRNKAGLLGRQHQFIHWSSAAEIGWSSAEKVK